MRSRFLRTYLLLISCAVFASTAFAQTPVPSTVFQIRGTQNGDDGVTASYRAFRNSGAPYRIVCSEPCTADLNAIYGLYAGFGQAYQEIIGLFGVAAYSSQQPFDLHIDEDHWCGPTQPGIGGDSQSYESYPYSGLAAGSWGCFWFTTPGHYAIPFHYPETSTLPYQLLTSHEFTHTEFFARHYYSYEDFAKAVSLYVSGSNGQPPVTDPCSDTLNEPIDGRFIWLMCHRNGFQWAQLAPAFVSLNNTFVTGKGAGYQGITSVYQFHKALNVSIGNDTLDAFLAAKASKVPLIGDDFAIGPAGGRVATLGGWASCLVPANAVAAHTPLHIDGAYVLNTSPPGLWTFENVYKISKPNGTDVSFAAPVELQLKYDPSLLDNGTDESTLKLYIYNGSTFQAVSQSRVDPGKRTVSTPITSTGTYVLAASSTTVTPTGVIARVLSNANVHTRVVLWNAGFSTITGHLVFHATGVAAAPTDPTIAYSLDYTKPLVLPDVVAAFGATGAGTVDIVPSFGPLPDVLASEIENSGYPGSIVPTSTQAAALHAGEQAYLVAPGNAQQENFRFVVRTFSAGVTLTVVARNTAGVVQATTPLSYAANTQFLVVPKDFSGGLAPSADWSYELDVQTGSALILTQTNESGQDSHNDRFAERVNLSTSTADDALHFPKALSITNPDGSVLRTNLQLTNPSSSTITGRVRYKPGDGSPAFFFNYSIPAFTTRAYADVVGGLGQSGAGAMDVTSTSGSLPIALARLVHAGNSTPFQLALEGSHDAMEVLQAGDRTLLAAPADTASNFFIGVRTLGKDLALTVTLNTSGGFQLKRFSTTIPAGTSMETAASTFLGMGLTGGEIIEIFVDGGAGFVYGSAANPATGAVNYQAARRLPYI